MIAIINRGPCSGGRYKYEVKINEDHICFFTHRRSDGLGICLMKAATAVNNHMVEELVKELVKEFADK